MLTKIAKECQHTKTCQLVVLHETQQLFKMRVVQEVHEMGFLYSDLGACKEKSWPMFFLS